MVGGGPLTTPKVDPVPEGLSDYYKFPRKYKNHVLSYSTVENPCNTTSISLAASGSGPSGKNVIDVPTKPNHLVNDVSLSGTVTMTKTGTAAAFTLLSIFSTMKRFIVRIDGLEVINEDYFNVRVSACLRLLTTQGQYDKLLSGALYPSVLTGTAASQSSEFSVPLSLVFDLFNHPLPLANRQVQIEIHWDSVGHAAAGATDADWAITISNLIVTSHMSQMTPEFWQSYNQIPKVLPIKLWETERVNRANSNAVTLDFNLKLNNITQLIAKFGLTTDTTISAVNKLNVSYLGDKTLTKLKWQVNGQHYPDTYDITNKAQAYEMLNRSINSINNDYRGVSFTEFTTAADGHFLGVALDPWAGSNVHIDNSKSNQPIRINHTVTTPGAEMFCYLMAHYHRDLSLENSAKWVE